MRVILRLKPGTKRGLIQALRAQGATVSADFTVVEAVAARLPVRLLRALQAHDAIEGMSSDADVTANGLSTSVSGAALNSVYSLRSTLGLQTTASTSSTKAFQQGSSYTGAVDTEVRLLYPTTSRGSVSSLEVDNDPNPIDGYQVALVRFDSLFGTGSNQIPVGSTITSATLTINHYADGDSSASASLHQMLVDWSGSSTWSSLLMSGPGIQFDNVEASSTADATVTNLAGTSAKAIQRCRADGGGPGVGERSAQRGWVISQNSNNGWFFKSSEDATVSQRPRLSVTYKAPVETTTLTGAGVTVAVIDSGSCRTAAAATGSRRRATSPVGAAIPERYRPGGRLRARHARGRPHRRRQGGGQGRGARRLVREPARARTASGVGSTSNVIKALQWAVANKATYGIDIINLSLGHPIYEPAATDPLVQAVEAAVRAGIVVVVVGRQLRHQSDDGPGRLRRHQLARQRAVGASRSAPSRRSTRRRAPTT